MTNKQTPAEIVANILDPKAYQEEQKRKEEIAKKAAQQAIKKLAAPPTKKYYDVKVSCMIPAELVYRILAENEHQALELIKGKNPNSVSHKLHGRKELLIKVYDSGSNIMRLLKRLVS
jgi:hypothetical protein